MSSVCFACLPRCQKLLETHMYSARPPRVCTNNASWASWAQGWVRKFGTRPVPKCGSWEAAQFGMNFEASQRGVPDRSAGKRLGVALSNWCSGFESSNTTQAKRLKWHELGLSLSIVVRMQYLSTEWLFTVRILAAKCEENWQRKWASIRIDTEFCFNTDEANVPSGSHGYTFGAILVWPRSMQRSFCIMLAASEKM